MTVRYSNPEFSKDIDTKKVVKYDGRLWWRFNIYEAPIYDGAPVTNVYFVPEDRSKLVSVTKHEYLEVIELSGQLVALIPPVIKVTDKPL